MTNCTPPKPLTDANGQTKRIHVRADEKTEDERMAWKISDLHYGKLIARCVFCDAGMVSAHANGVLSHLISSDDKWTPCTKPAAREAKQ